MIWRQAVGNLCADVDKKQKKSVSDLHDGVGQFNKIKGVTEWCSAIVNFFCRLLCTVQL